MNAQVFVPGDSSALSVGADAVAAALSQEACNRGVDLTIVRTGSRGLFWLEPLVEIETPAGRMGYGPVADADAGSLFECGFLGGGAHPKALGRVEDIPHLKRQQRLVFARCGLTDPLSLDDYQLRALESLGMRSWHALPLFAHGQATGVLSLATTGDQPRSPRARGL